VGSTALVGSGALVAGAVVGAGVAAGAQALKIIEKTMTRLKSNHPVFLDIQVLLLRELDPNNEQTLIRPVFPRQGAAPIDRSRSKIPQVQGKPLRISAINGGQFKQTALVFYSISGQSRITIPAERHSSLDEIPARSVSCKNHRKTIHQMGHSLSHQNQRAAPFSASIPGKAAKARSRFQFHL
jgi:hypothetical protein